MIKMSKKGEYVIWKRKSPVMIYADFENAWMAEDDRKQFLNEYYTN